MTGYYNRAGEPVTIQEWARSREATQIVAKTKVGDRSEVSTVHLGIDHQFGEGPPLIFETMVFSDNSRMDQYCERYSTEAEAVAGHARIVEMVREFDATLMPRITAEAIAERVAEIQNIGDDDPEKAHSREDDLYIDVLQQIADGTIRDFDAREIAAAALKAKDLDFDRWFA